MCVLSDHPNKLRSILASLVYFTFQAFCTELLPRFSGSFPAWLFPGRISFAVCPIGFSAMVDLPTGDKGEKTFKVRDGYFVASHGQAITPNALKLLLSVSAVSGLPPGRDYQSFTLVHPQGWNRNTEDVRGFANAVASLGFCRGHTKPSYYQDFIMQFACHGFSAILSFLWLIRSPKFSILISKKQ
jgi:hypothetical protein